MTDKKLNILIIISCYFPILGGAEKNAQLLAKKIISEGGKVKVITKLRSKDLPANEVIEGVPVKRVKNDVFGIFIEVLANMKQFDTVLFFDALGGKPGYKILTQVVLGTLLAKIFNKKVVLRLGSDREIYEKKLFNSKLILMLLNNFNLFLPNNQSAAEYLKTVVKNTNKILEPPFNLVDDTFLTPVTKEQQTKIKKDLGIPQDKIVLGFVGRVDTQKNIPNLLKAFETLDDKYVLLMAISAQLPNSQTLFNKLEQDFPILKSSRIKVLLNQDSLSVIQACDALILPSFQEGKPGVQLEALACGKPVISSNITTLKQSLPKELLGFTFNPFSPEDLAAKIVTFFSNQQPDAKIMTEYVKDQFSNETVFNKYKNALSAKSMPVEQNIKVLIQVPTFLPRIGGIQSAVKRISDELVKNGCEVVVLAKKDNTKLPKKDEIDGIKIIRYGPTLPEKISMLAMLAVQNFDKYMFMGNLNHLDVFQKAVLLVTKLKGGQTVLVMSSIDEGERKGVK